MTVALLFDIDSTLTPPRQPITKTMIEVLKLLTVPFHVAAGSHMALLEKQFFQPLYEFGFRGEFDAFISNGAIHYHADYSQGRSLELISQFEIHKHLGEQDYQFLADMLVRTLDSPEFQIPPSLIVYGERIINRGSMINCSPIGRLQQEDEEAQLNRQRFVEFDHASGYRNKVMTHLKNELSRLITERQLTITLGGQTSFDIGAEGKDKTLAARTLLDQGAGKVIFLGDALYEGGNDAVIGEFAKQLESEGSSPVEAIQVESWRDTIHKLQEMGFIGQDTTT